jgi:hypothetical protein
MRGFPIAQQASSFLETALSTVQQGELQRWIVKVRGLIEVYSGNESQGSCP